MPTLYMDDADFSEDEVPRDPGQPQEGGQEGQQTSGTGGNSTGRPGPRQQQAPQPAPEAVSDQQHRKQQATSRPEGAGDQQARPSAAASSAASSRQSGQPADQLRLSGTFPPTPTEASHLAKARARLDAVKAAAQVAGAEEEVEAESGGTAKCKAEGEGKAKGKFKAKGRPAGSKGTGKPAHPENGGDGKKVKCFAGRTPPQGKRKLNEFVSIQKGYTELRASGAPSAQSREYYKFFQEQKANFPDMSQPERVKKINEAWTQQHGQDGRVAKRKAKQASGQNKHAIAATPTPNAMASRIENIMQA